MMAIMDPGFELKLLMHPDRTRVELYNVTAADPFEAVNLAAEMPDVVQRLSAQLLAWENSMPPTPPAQIVLNPGCASEHPAAATAYPHRSNFAAAGEPGNPDRPDMHDFERA